MTLFKAAVKNYSLRNACFACCSLLVIVEEAYGVTIEEMAATAKRFSEDRQRRKGAGDVQ